MSEFHYKEFNKGVHTVITLGSTVADYWVATDKYKIRSSGKSISGYGLDYLYREMRKMEKNNKIERDQS